MQSTQPAERHFRKHWGFLSFFLASLFATIRLSFIQGGSAHYTLFKRAALELLAGNSPYGTDFGTLIGRFYYSPACALQIFLPLSFLPDPVAHFLFSLLSVSVFVWGSMSLFQHFVKGRDFRKELYWFFLIPPLLGAVSALKLELLTVGIEIGAVSLFLRNRVFPAALLLGWSLSWKFQTIPLIGLLFFALTKREVMMRTLGGLLWGFFGSLSFTFLFLSAPEFRQVHLQWIQELSAHLDSGLLHFENIFAFVKGWTGIETSPDAARFVSMGVGALFCFFVIRERRAKIPLILALSGFFSVTFPPLHQNNAMILVAPLIFSMCVSLNHEPFKEEKAVWWLILGAFLLYALSYSDFVGPSVRDAVYARKPKMIANFMCLIAFWVSSHQKKI